MKFFLIALLCIAAAASTKAPGSNRQGKLFLVSSSTTTTTLTTSSVCWVSTNTGLNSAACAGRRKKRSLINQAVDGEADIDISRVTSRMDNVK